MYCAEELAARGLTPLKPYFLAAAVPPPPPPELQAVGSTAGVRGDWVLGRERAVAADGSGEPRLSKRAAAAARASQRAVQLCNAFKSGRCTFGDGCRFSHDAEAFLANKPADLPGGCPFVSLAQCPYGLCCRYAGSHTLAGDGSLDGDQEARLPRPLAAVDPTTAGGGVDDSTAALAALAAAGGPTRQPPPGALLPVCALPACSKVEPESNGVSTAMLYDLRRNMRHFPAADARLLQLNCKISFRPARAAADEPPAEAADDDAGPDAASAAKRARTEPTATERTEAAHVADRPQERKLIDFSGKLYLAPLTTVGNLPFRRLAKSLGADITCSEMALATALLQGSPSEWALLRRHPVEDVFGIQLAGGYPDAVARAAELLATETTCDFVDINCGCPIDLVCDKGAGAALLRAPARMELICRAASALLPSPLTLKTRTGWEDGLDARSAHALAPRLADWGVSCLTLHGRTRAQRYAKTADWTYVARCAAAAAPLPVIGNGDVMSWTEYEAHVRDHGVASCLLARGALVKPWLFTEIKERRHWDISAAERFDLMRTFASHGLEHWGSDARGVESTRRFLLEWLAFAHRYVPVGLLDVLPQQLAWRTPAFVGRSALESLLASPAPADWVRLSSMLLGPPPPGYRFEPKHKSSGWADAATGGKVAQYDTEEANG
jgi:tRNA-dihydrouridine synthase 3